VTKLKLHAQEPNLKRKPEKEIIVKEETNNFSILRRSKTAKLNNKPAIKETRAGK
jgi:hypothetical protein